MNYIKQIEGLGACQEALEWLKQAAYPTLEEAWAACYRSDWMIWLLNLVPEGQRNNHAIVLCACDIAETVLRYVPAGEDRPKIAIETTRRWVRGEATISELVTARNETDNAALQFNLNHHIYHAALAAFYASDAAVSVILAMDALAETEECVSRILPPDDVYADIVRRYFPNAPELPSSSAQ